MRVNAHALRSRLEPATSLSSDFASERHHLPRVGQSEEAGRDAALRVKEQGARDGSCADSREPAGELVHGIEQGQVGDVELG